MPDTETQKANTLGDLSVNINRLIDGESIESERKDLVASWYLNSKVFEGKLIHSTKTLAKTISKKLDTEIDRKDIELDIREIKSTIRTSLSNEDKAEIVQEQVGLILNEAQKDRGRSVELYEQLLISIEIEQKRFEEHKRKNPELYEGTVENKKGLVHPRAVSFFATPIGKSLLFYLQTQQRVLFEANDRVSSMLQKILDFGNSKETAEHINRILNQNSDSAKEPLTVEKAMELLTYSSPDQDILPQESGAVDIDYDSFEVPSENLTPALPGPLPGKAQLTDLTDDPFLEDYPEVA